MVVGYRPCHVTRQIGPDDDNGDDDAPRMRRDTRPLHQAPPYLMTSSTGEARVLESHQSENFRRCRATTHWHHQPTAINRDVCVMSSHGIN